MALCFKINITYLVCAFIFFLVIASNSLSAEQVTIKWSGIDGELLENARQYVLLSQENTNKLTEQRIKYLFDVADEAIIWSLRPFGYYNVQIDSKLIKPSAQNSSWQADFNIKLNKPIIIQDLHITISGEAKNDPQFQQFISSFPLQKNDILNHQSYEKGKRALQDFALQRGYLDAQLQSHKIKIYKKTNQAQINLYLDSGPRYCIDHVRFEQNQFKAEFLARYIPFNNGDAFSL